MRPLKIVMLLFLLFFSVYLSACDESVNIYNSKNRILITVQQLQPDDVNNKIVEKFKKVYPNIDVKMDKVAFDYVSYWIRAESGQLPTLYYVWLSEFNKVVDKGYVADLTNCLDKNRVLERINPELAPYIMKNNKTYGLLTNTYTLGLALNVEMFRNAGLVDGNGNIIIPQTWDDFVYITTRLTDKTKGVYGFAIPTMNNIGGFHFMSWIWSAGGEIEENNGGKWKAKFDSPEAEQAVNFIKDLKWVYNVMPDDVALDEYNLTKMFVNNKLGCMVTVGSESRQFFSDLASGWWGISDKSLVVPIPHYKDNKSYSLFGGGSVAVISNKASEAQIDAVLKWLKASDLIPDKYGEFSMDLYIQYKEHIESITQRDTYSMGIKSISPWKKTQQYEQFEKMLKDDVYKKDKSDLWKYEGQLGKNLKIEPEKYTQEIYTIFDSVLQDVLEHKDIDVRSLLKRKAEDFQKNYLDPYNSANSDR